MKVLTDIQCRVLEFIIREIKERRLPPTHREIAAHFQWTSNAAAKCHLLGLEKKGFIRTISRISRGIEVKPSGWEWMMPREGGDK
jgi:SOS-response transcriptional repressor LexA